MLEGGKGMISIWYSENQGKIVAKSDDYFGDRLYLKGGIWKQKEKKYYYPLNWENVHILLDRYYEVPNVVWKSSLYEALISYKEKKIKKKVHMSLLKRINMDTIDKFKDLLPTLHPDLPPFKNQRISQHWSKYTDSHSMLWEMGPLDGKTLIITDKGIIKLKDYRDELVANPEGLHSTNGLIERESTELITIETYHGPKLTGTPEHEILTIEGTKTFSELTLSDKLLIGFPNIFPKESLVNDDYACALGMMVAEGCCNLPQIEFNFEGNEDLIEKIRTELLPQGETTRIVGDKETWRAWWSTATLRKTKGNSFPVKYSENGHKIVPECILRSNKNTQIRFLYGYFRGDGRVGIHSNNLNFKLTEGDENLVDLVQLMLFNLGIATKKYKYKDVNAFNLTAPHNETVKMIDLGLIWKPYGWKQKEPNFGWYGKAGMGNNGKQYKYKDNHLITKIVLIKREVKRQKVYCLSMNNDKHLFYGNGITVHNTGKTRSGVENYLIKKKAKKVSHCLVICPVSMLDKWVDEVEKWSTGIYAVAVKGTKKDKLEILEADADWYVTNYETAMILEKELLEKVDEKWLIILDESTKIKNPHAGRSKTCHKLGLLTDYKMILTGTPVTQHAYDLFSPYLFLDKGETFGLQYDNFINQYYWRSGYRLMAKRGTLEDISDKIFESSTRFRKKDCIDIPDKVYDHVMLELPPYNQQKYNEMVEWCITRIENSEMVTAPVILTQLLRLSQITSGFVVDEYGQIVDFEEQPKLRALQDIIESSNGSKIIVWTRFLHDVERIMAMCKKNKIGAVEMTSRVKQEDRTVNIAKFQSDNGTKLICGTAGTGGHGIDLVAGSIVVYYSNDYSLENRLQSEDRAHRAGQINKVTYIDLLCKGTIDQGIYKILRNKKSVADVVTKDNIYGLF